MAAVVREDVVIHPTADVAANAVIGRGTRIWHQAQVREGATIGPGCILGKGSYVDAGVRIGANCKLQNSVFVFHGFDLEDGVFLGPGVMLLNDKHPRAINPDGTLKSDADWTVSSGLVEYGAAVGGGAIVLPGVRVGRYALVGSGAVVTKDVPAHAVVFGNPARMRGWACACAGRLVEIRQAGREIAYRCSSCGGETWLPASVGEVTEI